MQASKASLLACRGTAHPLNLIPTTNKDGKTKTAPRS